MPPSSNLCNEASCRLDQSGLYKTVFTLLGLATRLFLSWSSFRLPTPSQPVLVIPRLVLQPSNTIGMSYWLASTLFLEDWFSNITHPFNSAAFLLFVSTISLR